MASSPWRDGEFGISWSPEAKASNAFRDLQVDLILRIASTAQPETILDLGCGPGTIIKAALECFPRAHAVGLDISSECLARATEHLRGVRNRVTLVEWDFGRDWTELLEPRFDVVIASQSLHHLPPDTKSECISMVARITRPGGLFIINDRIELSSEHLFEQYVAVENHGRQSGGFDLLPDNYTLDAYHQRHRTNADLPSSVECHLASLRTSGFEADCLWRHGVRAIVVGRRT